MATSSAVFGSSLCLVRRKQLVRFGWHHLHAELAQICRQNQPKSSRPERMRRAGPTRDHNGRSVQPAG